MNPQYIQNLRYKLQRRVSRLNGISNGDSFRSALIQFWSFFDQQPIYMGIVEELLAKFIHVDADNLFGKMLENREPRYGTTEEEAAFLGYKVLHELADGTFRMSDLEFVFQRRDLAGAIEGIREIYLEPFYDYIDEQLDDNGATLALLKRYKHRSEWFHQSNLWQLKLKDDQQKRSQLEGSLALDLYAYLHDQGLDFNIETESLRGKIDLIAAQRTDDPLLLDVKIFDNNGRNKQYICKGFRQIYTYTQQYNEPFGYLTIFKTCEEELRFALRQVGDVPVVTHNHKTIFFIVIDLYEYEQAISQRKPLKVVEITEDDLIQILQELEEANE